MPPTLSVDEVTLDPIFTDWIVVKRRPVTINQYGENVIGPVVETRVAAVVTVAHGNDLDRLDDNQRMGRNLSIVIRHPLRGPAPGYQPDTIRWQGDDYVVKTVDPYPQFGAGFVQAIAGSIDSLDQPQTERPQGAFIFSTSQSYGLIGAIA